MGVLKRLTSELEGHVTRWKCHIIYLFRVPRRHNDSSGLRKLSDLMNRRLELIYTPMSPLITIYRPQFTIFRPIIPHISHRKGTNLSESISIGRTIYKPQHFARQHVKTNIFRSE